MISTLLNTEVKSTDIDSKILRRWPECTGVDIICSDVYNAYDGLVVFVGFGLDNRYCVCVQIDGTQIIRYCHLTEEYVSPNDAIKAGVKIGKADEYVRVEYCVSDDLIEAIPENIVRILGATYVKVDPYAIVSGESEIVVSGVSAYVQAETGQMIDYAALLSAENFTPYIATLPDASVPDSTFKGLKDKNVVGVMLYGGGLYDVVHLKKSKYRSNNIEAQVKSAAANELLYGLYVDVRARSVDEAKEECKQLFYLISKYPPQLGLWLNLLLTSSNLTNDSILQYYMDKTFEWGLIGQVGLYCGKSQLGKLSWETKWCEYYLLWLVEHNARYIETQDDLLTPVDFQLNPKKKSSKRVLPQATNSNSAGHASNTTVVSGNGTFTHPCPGMSYRSSYFGEVRHGIGDTTPHKGHDYAAPAKTPIYAAAAGTVTIAGYSNSAGYWVVINHGDGLVTKYMHMYQMPDVTAGQKVNKGQKIGGVGTTGQSTGNHLHFQVELNGVAVNPDNYL